MNRLVSRAPFFTRAFSGRNGRVGGDDRRAARVAGATSTLGARIRPLLVIDWLLLVSGLAAIVAWVSVSTRSVWWQILGRPVAEQFERAGVAFNAGAFVAAVGMSVAVGLLSPRRWRRVMIVLTTAPVPVLILTSRGGAATLIALAFFLPAIWLGRELAARALRERGGVDSWVIGAALGLGGIAALGFVLGVVGWLRPWVIWPVLIACTLALLTTVGASLRRDLTTCWSWSGRPVTRRPAHLVLAGLALAFFWLNLIGALAPETSNDAVRQRLAVPARFAEQGRLSTGDPDLSVAADPALGEIALATVLALGSPRGAKILVFVTGLLCAAAVFALGRRLAGAAAGAVAACAFYTMPLVAWLSQNVYLDLFTTLFAVAAVLAIVHRARAARGGAIIAGVCLGFGVATKVHFGYLAVGVGVTLGMATLWRDGGGVALRRVGLLAAVAVLTAAPWLGRSYALTGQIPGWALATAALGRPPGERPAIMFDLAGFGFGRSPLHLALAPIDVTLRSNGFESTPTPAGPHGGLIGFLLLALVPLLLAARPRRRTLAVLAGTLAASVLWFYTAQYLRYALPILALLCPIGGAAYVAARRQFAGVATRRVMDTLLVVLALLGASVQVPVANQGLGFALGREDEATYLTKYMYCCDNYTVARQLEAQPDATRAFTIHDFPRLYGRVRVSGPFTVDSGVDPEDDEAAVLAQLDRGGYSHIVVDRRLPRRNWDRKTVIGEEFLRRNTALVGGEANAYLYRLLPPSERGGRRPWAEGTELLPTGGFERAGADGAPLGWARVGRPAPDQSGAARSGRFGSVRLGAEEGLVATVPVVPGSQYLLAHATRSVEGYGAARLHIDWLDSAGRMIGAARETVPVSPRAYHTFSMLATAPSTAVAAGVRLEVAEGAIWFDEISLRPVRAEGHTDRDGVLPAASGDDRARMRGDGD